MKRKLIELCALVTISVIGGMTIVIADSTVIQPIEYAAPVSITINLTPNEPVSLPLMRDTKHMKITIPEGQRISVDGAEVRGIYESNDQIRTVTVFDADRVTVSVEESK